MNATGRHARFGNSLLAFHCTPSALTTIRGSKSTFLKTTERPTKKFFRKSWATMKHKSQKRWRRFRHSCRLEDQYLCFLCLFVAYDFPSLHPVVAWAGQALATKPW